MSQGYRKLFRVNILGRLSALSILQVRVISTILVLVVGYVDGLTGVTVSFTLMYVVPIVFVSWRDGPLFALGLCILSAGFMFFGEFGHLPLAVVFWNSFSRLAILIGVPWTLNEIHEMQRTRLQLEVDKYTRVVETVIEGIIALDVSGRVTYANTRMARLLGYSVSEMIGMQHREFIRDENSRKLVEERWKSTNGLDPGPLEVQFVKKDGTDIWTLVNSSWSQDEHPEGRGRVLLVTDISGRKKAEDDLKRQYRQTSAVGHLSDVLARSVHLESRLEGALKTVLDVTGFEAGAIFMLDDQGKDLTAKYHMGVREDALQIIQRWPVGGGITGRVCQTGVAQFLDDALQSDQIDHRMREIEEIRAFAAIPLISKDAVLGVLSILRRSPMVFSNEDKSLLKIFGNQIGVALDNAKMYDAARASERQIRSLSIDLVRIQEEERRRFARELHDGLAQVLMTLRVNAELALNDLDSANVKVEKRLRELVAVAGEAESEAKQISYDLRPAILDDFGLKAAFEVLAKNFIRRTGIEVDLHLPESDVRFDSVIETTAYRIVQELLANAAKHSHASLVTIQLLLRRNLLALTVADNGTGFDPGETAAFAGGRVHSGLRNMRERAESLKGMFRVESAPGRGAEFVIELPCSLAAVEVESNGGKRE